MSDPMQEIMASFFVECEELHESLVDALQSFADGEADIETINVAFRAVHSIKGGAGAFGLDDLVDFAHQFETVMDACRSGDLDLEERLTELFLRCSDMLSDLIRCSRDGDAIDTAASKALIDELSVWVASDEEEGDEEEIEFQPMTLDLGDLAGPAEGEVPDLPPLDDLPTLEGGETGAGKNGILVEFCPDWELYESGNEPLFLIKALADLGACRTEIKLDPPKNTEDLESLGGRLSWKIFIETESPLSAVHEVFEFAEGLCKLTVTESEAEAPAKDVPAEVAAPAASAPVANVVEMPAEPAKTETPPPPKPADKKAPPPAAAGKRASANSKSSPTVRVDLERIERLVNLVGELVINQAMLSQSIVKENIPPNSPVSAGLDEFMQLTRNIQESVMMIRAAGEISLSTHVQDRARSLCRGRQKCSSHYRWRIHRNRQDRDREAGRSPDPHDPQCGGSWAGRQRSPGRARQA